MAQRIPLTDIAKKLNRPTSTVSREVKRNGGIRTYRAYSANKLAGKLAASRRQDKRLLASHEAIYQYIYVLPRGAFRQELI